MSKIFISFLGTGALKAVPGYKEVGYFFENSVEQYTSCFAQRAIIEKHQAESFDKICLLMTPESRDKHRDLLIDELIEIGCQPEVIIEDDSITTNQSTEQQWKWFDSLQRQIDDGDEVIFDFTHGFRSVPIIFSTAISFLQKVKSFKLLHAYYGYVDVDLNKGEIIDMAKFYRINEWADGVSRLVDMADASKLAELAEEGKADGFAALSDEDLTKALHELTDLIKNIDVNNVGQKADEALRLIAAKKETCTGADEQLLEMVVEKFSSLAILGSGRYDYDYFRLQLALSEMLLKHGLNMQAFTVMREMIASLGMLGAMGKYAKSALNTSKGRTYRKNIGEMFFGLCVTKRDEWIQETDPEKYPVAQLNYFNDMVLPFYERLEKMALIEPLAETAKKIQIYRNGLNHAWTNQKEVRPDISKAGEASLASLSEVLKKLNEQGVLVES